MNSKPKFKGKLSLGAFKKINIKIQAGNIIVDPEAKTIAIKEKKPKLKTNYKKIQKTDKEQK